MDLAGEAGVRVVLWRRLELVALWILKFGYRPARPYQPASPLPIRTAKLSCSLPLEPTRYEHPGRQRDE